MINTGIQNFYTYLKTNGKLPKPATIAPNPNEALSNAVFGPPAVMIEASTANFTSVKLHLTLQSGVAKVIQKYEAPSEANDNNQLLEIAYLKMKDMHVIVPCNIGRRHGSRSDSCLAHPETRLHRSESKFRPGKGDESENERWRPFYLSATGQSCQ
jgi:hypothetical protein